MEEEERGGEAGGKHHQQQHYYWLQNKPNYQAIFKMLFIKNSVYL